ncbi:iron complex transport system substrate-binding protein [Micromonospora pallida]|uniref:Iron complex transport system substrate-binding protein n=1 Tax=Micromonospora pallida TaxID=145854 RepID=A0A1C6RIW4_9ACTN|nr:ABC transporter substrate-binding protein [Micromonospora pallida]SCL17108.1 iron complex transport system substrate-binding protein [Micromonospora pallida]
MIWRAKLPSLAGVVALAVALAGCGNSAAGGPDGSGPTPNAPAVTAPSTYTTVPAEGRTSYPLEVDNCGVKLRFEKAPQRVLILNGTSVAEAQYFVLLGLQDRVLANAQSYGVLDDPGMPAAVQGLPKGGLKMNTNFDVPREQVLALKPDLVVSAWSGGFDARSGFATREELSRAGIASWVPPFHCAYGKADATEAEKRAFTAQSITSGFETLTALGEIFDVPQHAATVVDGLRKRVTAVRTSMAGQPRKNMIVAFPGMSMMTAQGVPAVLSTGVADDVVAAAGGVSPFAGRGTAAMAALSREELADTPVDILVLGLFTRDERPEEEAEKLFKAFPQWSASKTRSFVAIGDGAYPGPSNVYAVEKIAKAVRG